MKVHAQSEPTSEAPDVVNPLGRPLHVVVLNYELPYPMISGNRLRTLNLLLPLARRHRITFLARRNENPDEIEKAAAFLRGKGINAEFVDGPVPARSGLGFYARLAANLASPLPYHASAHVSDGVRAAIQRLADSQTVDLWQTESLPFLGALKNVRDRPKFLNAQNVETLIWKRHAETESSPLKHWFLTQQWKKYDRYERWAFAEATRVAAVSQQDAELMRGEFGARRVDVVDNGIDRTYFESVERRPRPGRILFLGSLTWRPNLDALNPLLDEIFPAVRAEIPGATLALVGRDPSDSLVRRVAAMPGVELHASVPDVRPYLSGSMVMTVPLRVGGGSRLKILEAMAAGLPVVSTRVGAEGLEITAGRDYTQADEPAAMARALVECLRDPESAEATARRARPYVLDRYDWNRLAGDMERTWFRCLKDHAALNPSVGGQRSTS